MQTLVDLSTALANPRRAHAARSLQAARMARVRRAAGSLLLAAFALGCKSKEAAVEDAAAVEAKLPPFSFFVTSYDAMQRLSGSAAGFGGDLRFGETGAGAGLRGADKICTAIAEESMPGAGAKQWRAFLSATRGGPDDGPVHAIDRIGEGPWYDRHGRIVSMNKAGLIQQRPAAHDDIKNDLPNELGVPNHNPDGKGEVDNHDTLTGSNEKGELFADDPRYTCDDWTKSEPDPDDSPRVGHSWPRTFGPGFGGFGPPGGGPPWSRDGGVPDEDAGGFDEPPGGFPTGGFPPPPPDGGFFPPPPGGPWPDGGMGPGGFPGFPDFANIGLGDPAHWISSLNEAGCGAGASLIEMGPPWESNPTVGSGGGYGGFYCFALTP